MTPKERLVTVIGVPDYAEAKRILHKHRIEKLPIVDEQGKLQGLLTIKDIQKARNFPSSCTDDMGRLRVGAAIGVGEGELPRAEALLNASVDVLVSIPRMATRHGDRDGPPRETALPEGAGHRGQHCHRAGRGRSHSKPALTP
jgi:IMP dehydrogenase